MSILDINEDRGNKAVSQINNKYKVSADRVLFIKCDVTNKNKFEGKHYSFVYDKSPLSKLCKSLTTIILCYTIYILDAFRKTIDKFGKLNIVINNAGIMTKYITSWERAIDLNYVRFFGGSYNS